MKNVDKFPRKKSENHLQTLHIEEVPVVLVNRMRVLAAQRKMTLKQIIIEILQREVNK